MDGNDCKAMGLDDDDDEDDDVELMRLEENASTADRKCMSVFSRCTTARMTCCRLCSSFVNA